MLFQQYMTAQLGAMRQDCEAQLRQAIGDSTMCALHKEGRITGGLKYQEGRLVVLGTMLRQAKRLPASDDAARAALMGLLDEENARWQAQLTTYEAQKPQSLAWVAYSQGGVDALEAIRQAAQAQPEG